MLDCQKKKEPQQIAKYTNIVTKQYAAEKNFEDIFPWLWNCQKSPYVHFIAHSKRADGSTIILGWLTLLVLEHNGKPHGSISEISTRRVRDEFYGGVGKRLNDAVVAWATKEGLEFLYLWPLNETVRAIYMRPEWGYLPKQEDVRHLFRVLRGEPPADFLATLVRTQETEDAEMMESLEEHLDTIEGIVESFADEELQDLWEKAKEYLDTDNPPHIGEFIQSAQLLESWPEEEQVTAVYELLKAFVDKQGKKGGRRKSRKSHKSHKSRRRQQKRKYTRRRHS